MATVRHPLQTSFSFFKAVTPTNRYYPQLVHAIVTRNPEKIKSLLEHFANQDKKATTFVTNDLSVNQLDHLEKYPQGLFGKPLELAIALHGPDEATENNSYESISVLANNWNILERLAEFYNCPSPDYQKIRQKAAENKDEHLLDWLDLIMREKFPEVYKKTTQFDEAVDPVAHTATKS